MKRRQNLTILLLMLFSAFAVVSCKDDTKPDTDCKKECCPKNHECDEACTDKCRHDAKECDKSCDSDSKCDHKKRKHKPCCKDEDDRCGGDKDSTDNSEPNNSSDSGDEDNSGSPDPGDSEE